MIVGVLLAGSFREHQGHWPGMGSVLIKKPEQLEGISGLIIPGGESTTIGKLLNEFSLLEPVKKMGEEGLPIFGTCAGLILLARNIAGSEQPRLGLMDITVERNAFGRQVDSFEVDTDIPALGPEPFRAVFIRAPYILGVGSGVEVLASFDLNCFCQTGKVSGGFLSSELTGFEVHRISWINAF